MDRKRMDKAMLDLCCKLAETIQCKDSPARCACRGDEKCKKTIVCYSDWMKWLKKTNKQNDAINLYTTFRCLIDWLENDDALVQPECDIGISLPSGMAGRL